VARGVALAAIVGLLATPRAASADVVLHWNEIAVNAAIATGQSPFAQARYAAIVQVAVFTAVNAIGGEYEPYLDTVTAQPGASKDAAVVQAAYRVLTTYFGSNATVLATLNTERTNSLAAIPDGPAENAGIAAGEAAAKAITDLRANDGSTPAQTYTVPTNPPPPPGGWLATPNCPSVGGVQVGSFLHWRNVAPFGIDSVSAFLPPPPPALTSNEYAKAYNEVKAIGDLNHPEARPQDRADVVNFYAPSSPTYVFNMVLRQIAAAKGESLEENARSLALLNMAISDALVASFNAKYVYLYWRPETAIHAGGTDGNGKTAPEPGFRPYLSTGTPCFPSYPSNHASGSNAGAEMLRRLYGAAGFEIVLTNPAVPGITLEYSQLREIISDVSDARVYGGIHFRFDQDAGERMGREIATSVYKNNLRPLHGNQ
jgi:hypothetical protein